MKRRNDLALSFEPREFAVCFADDGDGDDGVDGGPPAEAETPDNSPDDWTPPQSKEELQELLKQAKDDAWAAAKHRFAKSRKEEQPREEPKREPVPDPSKMTKSELVKYFEEQQESSTELATRLERIELREQFTEMTAGKRLSKGQLKSLRRLFMAERPDPDDQDTWFAETLADLGGEKEPESTKPEPKPPTSNTTEDAPSPANGVEKGLVPPNKLTDAQVQQILRDGGPNALRKYVDDYARQHKTLG